MLRACLLVCAGAQQRWLLVHKQLPVILGIGYACMCSARPCLCDALARRCPSQAAEAFQNDEDASPTGHHQLFHHHHQSRSSHNLTREAIESLQASLSKTDDGGGCVLSAEVRARSALNCKPARFLRMPIDSAQVLLA